ncbi:MAG: 6-phosphogluconolactonase [Nitrospiraceae bacterium]|nr:MAG: 6-phosphogluconolactonase [Nitrospiraceae bacterium]
MENVTEYPYNTLMKNRKIRVFEYPDQLVDYAIGKWSDMSEDAIEKRGLFTVALSGGSTPVYFYKKLSGINLNWNKTHIFIVDERFVPFDHRDSNVRMMHETLLGNVDIPEKNIHSVTTEKGRADEAAHSYESDIVSFFKLSSGALPEFDLILLGLGYDGHTASLFPGSSALTVDDRLAVSVTPPDGSMHDRVSITFPVINNARNILFFITGSKKAEVVKDVLENEDSTLPASSVKPRQGKLIYLLDRQAGALLSGSTR